MINLEYSELYSGLDHLGASDPAPWSLEAPGLHDTNLNTLVTQVSAFKPTRSQELLGQYILKKSSKSKLLIKGFF